MVQGDSALYHVSQQLTHEREPDMDANQRTARLIVSRVAIARPALFCWACELNRGRALPRPRAP